MPIVKPLILKDFREPDHQSISHWGMFLTLGSRIKAVAEEIARADQSFDTPEAAAVKQVYDRHRYRKMAEYAIRAQAREERPQALLEIV